ncbi:MAG: fibronectin type III domain-containing protein, partial [Clostridia bacterium]|nr:fibronectin type III domain-containing protein [Clostridia bacterium]
VWGGYDAAGVSAKAVAAASTVPALTGAIAAPGQITVKWNPVNGATKYAVYRKAVGTTGWTRLTNTIAGTSYVDTSTDLVAGTTYYYTVRAYVGGVWGGYDAAGVSAKAVAAASTVPALTGAIAAPGQITVKWNPVNGATKYAVYRKAVGATSWTRLTNTATGASYVDTSTDLVAGTTYYYTVRAYVGGAWGGYDAAGVGAKAIAAASTVPVLTGAIAAPGQITVKWNPVNGATKYAVYRKAVGATGWTRLTNTIAGTFYVDTSTDLVAGTTYYYTVRAYVGGVWGGYDAVGVGAKAVAAASAVPVLTGAAAAPGQITVKWNPVNGATKYAVYRKAAGATGWTRLTNTATGASYVDTSTDLVAGTIYYYTVRACVGGTWGGYDAAGVSAKAK